MWGSLSLPGVKRNFEYDDAETNVKRYGGEGRLDGFAATFLSSYLASSAVLGCGRKEEKKGGEKKEKKRIVLARRSRQFLAVVRESFAEVGERYDPRSFRTRGHREPSYLQIPTFPPPPRDERFARANEGVKRG